MNARLFLLGLLLASSAYGQGPVTAVVSPYAITQRGPNSRLWQQVIASTNSSGQTNYFTNSYNELGTGICFWNSNSSQWVDSSDQIQLNGDGAVATNTQHQVSFAANINTAGAINLTTPDGKQMTSQLLGLAYFDADSNTNVLFAELQDSIGQLLSSGNQVLYSNAFTNADCDVLYTHRLSSFEQDIIIREQLPSPSSAGLTGSNIWLQVWTEFTNAPVPQITPLSNGDSFLDFGIMKMGKGTAFLLGGPSNNAPVIKEWVTNEGRTFLVESVHLRALSKQLSLLPAFTSGSSNSAPGTNSSGSSGLGAQLKNGNSRAILASLARPHTNGKTLKLPPRKVAKRELGSMRFASSGLDERGLLLDYQTVNGSVSNQIFQSDTTYYVSSELDCYGTNTIEGGTVIKCGVGNGVFVYGDFVCDTAPYRPAIFTVTNDDSVGAIISGSDGGCSLTINSPFYLPSSSTMSNIFFRYSWNAFNSDSGDAEIWDCQFYKCSHCITPGSDSTNLGLHNVLIVMDDSINNSTNYCGCGTGAIVSYSSAISVYGENITANLDSQNLIMYFVYDDCYANNTTFAFTNSIIITPNLNPQYNYGSPPAMTVSTNTTFYATTLPSGLFTNCSDGYCYLPSTSIYHSFGNTNISSGLINDLAQKTTYAPMILANTTISSNTTLSPQALRDTNSLLGYQPDLGYHYDPIDFILSNNAVGSGAILTFTNGVAIACEANATGFSLERGATLVSIGSPLVPNWLTRNSTVQEAPATNTSYGSFISSAEMSNYPASIQVTWAFTHCSLLAEDPLNYVLPIMTGVPLPVNLSGCEFYGGTLDLANSLFTITNCLFQRVQTYLYNTGSNSPVAVNNLFWRGSVSLGPFSTNTIVQNNLFDCAVVQDYGLTAYIGGYNGYYSTNNSVNVLTLTNGNDIFLTNSLAYESSWFGNFYQPTNSPFLNKGSTTANLLGLYHYTTQTNQAVQGDNIVDIGYHYVAVGNDGLPIDTNDDGIPDYLEDVNGNGLWDNGETDWMVMLTDPNNIGPTGLEVYTPLTY